MLELPHVVAGAVIATKIPHPLISIPLAFLSHFFIDLIPHWNPSLYKETQKSGKPSKKSTWFVIGDVVLSLGVGFFLATRVLPNLTHALIILTACFAAVVADVVEGFYFFFNIRPLWLERLIEFQHRHQGRTAPIPGLITQVVLILLAFWILFV